MSTIVSSILIIIFLALAVLFGLHNVYVKAWLANHGFVQTEVASTAQGTQQPQQVAPLANPASVTNRLVYEINLQVDGLLQAGKQSEALPLLDKAIAADPSYWRSSFLKGKILCEAGQTSQGLSYLNKAYAQAPGEPITMVTLAQYYFKQGDLDNALQLFRQFIKSFPNDENCTYAYKMIGLIAAKRGYESECAEAFKKAISLEEQKRVDQATASNTWIQAARNCEAGKFSASAKYFYEGFLSRFPHDKEASDASNRLLILSYQNQRGKVDALAANYAHSGAAEKDLDQFVVPFDNRCSAKGLAMAKVGMAGIPAIYRRALMAAGYKVVVAHSLTEALPDIADQHPRGWKADASWHNVNGTFNAPKKWIVIGEHFTSIFTRKDTIDQTIDKTACHEFGHAYDYYLGSFVGLEKSNDASNLFSHCSRFSAAYDTDVRAIPDSERSKLAYFLQAGNAGKEELFAEVCKLLDGSMPQPGSSTELIPLRFRTVLKELSSARQQVRS